MIKNTGLIQAKEFKVGLYTSSDIINSNPDLSPNCMDIKWYFDASIGKRLGCSSTNTVAMTSGGSASGFIVGNALTNGLISYWKLDETSGQRSDTFSVNHLASKNNVTSIVGIRNNAALFVASNSQGLIGTNSSALNTGDIPFQIAGWFYLNSTSATVESTIISKRDPDVDAATVLLLHCDGADGSTTFTDSSPSAKTVTAVGNAQVDTAQKQFGTGSALFDGTGDSLTIPDSADWDFGTADFSVDFRVRFNSVASTQTFIDRHTNIIFAVLWRQDTEQLSVYLQGSNYVFAWTPSINIWYHVALTRNGINLRAFINGLQIGTTQSDSTNIGSTQQLVIGSNDDGTSPFNGWLDEIRVTKGVARWIANFTSPAFAYNVKDYEYWLFVNTNNQLTFRVSSSGTVFNGQISSAGNINLSTWYNYIAWHQTAGGSTAAHIGISVNQNITTGGYTSGVRVGSAPLVLGSLSDGIAGVATKYIDGREDEVGFWKREFQNADSGNLYAGGSGNTFTSGVDSNSWASFDFGASNVRWLTIAAGTGIFASSNLGTTFVTISTSRTANYQYLDRSKNVLIATSDSYDPNLYWAGSAGTFAVTLAPNSAPSAKFSVNYQGFLVLLNYTNSNGTVSNRGFTYEDENTQLSGDWVDRFDLPSSDDDEITGPFILNKFLYVSTKFRIFRLNYTGGNPDWQYIQVKNFGFVPRTVKVFTLKQGQVAVGLDWSRRLRAFDGYDDQILSDNVENNNNYCDFSTEKISLSGSGLVVSNAEFDPIEQEYRLNVSIGMQSTQTTHAIVLNARTLAMYPYSNQPYNTMCMASSAGKQFLVAADRSGFVHILNSGNLDLATPINEIYDSPLLFNKSPSEVTKNKQLNLFFQKNSCGTIYYQQRFDFSNVFSEMRSIRNKDGQAELTSTESSLQILRTVDVPSVQNVYQYRLTSSAGTANPWKLTHFDLLNTSLGYGRGG